MFSPLEINLLSQFIMGGHQLAITALLTLVLVLAIAKILQLGWILVWRPYVLTKFFKKQGVKGPPYSFFHGSLKDMRKFKLGARNITLDLNSNDIIPKALPHYHIWSSIYGETMLHWQGPMPVITIPDPEVAKHVLGNKSGFWEKPKMRPASIALAGRGLGTISGADWVRHRKIINPAFSTEKLKAMTKRMAACTMDMVDEWKNQGGGNNKFVEIEANREFQKLTADIIAHTGFSSSYVEGKEAFKALQELQKFSASKFTEVDIPGAQYLPTPSNLRMWELEARVKKPLKRIIEGRLRSVADGNSNDGYGDDILGVMIEALDSVGDNRDNSLKLKMDEIVEECKSFFFAGHETTANLLTWATFLLSLHQDWQERVREEVLSECGMAIPNANMLSKLKLANMVFLETLRLYNPVLWLGRNAAKDMELGDLTIPKGTQVAIPIVKIHRMKEYWGEDADEFNPMRFKDGISQAAKHPNAFLPFGIGPRICIGQNFAMLEAKTVLALLLQRFSFSLSPHYKHAPTQNVIVQPQFGIPIIAKPLDS